MLERMSTAVKVLVIINLIVHISSIILLGLGIFLTVMAFFDYTGLSAIFGIPMAMWGFVLLGGFFPSMRMLKGDPRGRESIVYFSVIALVILWSLYFFQGPSRDLVGLLFNLHLDKLFIPVCWISIMYVVNIFLFTRPAVIVQFGNKSEAKSGVNKSGFKFFTALYGLFGIIGLVTLFFTLGMYKIIIQNYGYSPWKYYFIGIEPILWLYSAVALARLKKIGYYIPPVLLIVDILIQLPGLATPGGVIFFFVPVSVLIIHIGYFSRKNVRDFFKDK